jgi:hypothetical protein
VVSAHPGNLFQDIKVKPAVELARLEEVLIVTGQGKPVAGSEAASDALTAAQIRQKQLPTIPDATVVPRTGPPPPMAQILAERRRAAMAAAKAANAEQQGIAAPVTQPDANGQAPGAGGAHGIIPASGKATGPAGAKVDNPKSPAVHATPAKPAVSPAQEAIPPGEN